MLSAMRLLIISDLHSNIEALDGVLADAQRRGGFERILCAGDIVGYGADPAAVIAALRERDATCVAGNHDLAAIGRMDTAEFNRVAAQAARWTEMALDADERAWLASLPLVATIGDLTIVHGSLRSPEWEYLLDPEQADAQFALQETPYSVVGHSHLQFWSVQREDDEAAMHRATDGTTVRLEGRRLILNPGSTGQPRDGDARAGYILYDDASGAAGTGGAVTWHRVAYDAETARRKILDAGLPAFLGDRLLEGR